ncbi:MAG: fumarylacetoacetate hydrolase family protein, partial [Neisseriaceae bacterium]|nr:fumarylacetoacetate hydrolase family protein [Neisseriaceae bacterium]
TQDDEIMVFIKPNTAIHFEGSAVQLPNFSKNVHYECEIVILIGKDITETSIKNPLDYIAGYALGIDLTARDVQKTEIEKGLPWLKSKGFKQAALISQFISPKKIPNPDNIYFELAINQKTVQVGESHHMIYSTPTIIQSIHQIYGLKKGDIIYTGTPKGVGQLQPNDVLELNLEKGLLKAQFTIA